MTQLLPIEELNVISAQVRDAEVLDKQVLEDEILEFLIYSYTLGNNAVNDSFDLSQKVNVDKLKDSIYKSVKDETFMDRVSDYVDKGDREGIIRVIDTEMHRNYNTGIFDTAKSAPLKFKKKWSTRLDDKVRATHDYLEGVEVDLDSEFVTYDGDSAKYPGDFLRPENNVNCRCVIDLILE